MFKNFEYDGSDTVSGLFIGGITGSLGTNFTHGTYDNTNFTGSDFTGSMNCGSRCKWR